MIELINLKSKDPLTQAIKKTGNYIYIGRETQAGHKRSPLANPYMIPKDGSRRAVIEKYKIFLWGQLSISNITIRNELERIYQASLEGTVYLGCWCHPERCHGDVIIEAIQELFGESYAV